MPAFVVKRRAPMDSNSLAAFELAGLGLDASSKVTSTKVTYTKPTAVKPTAPTSGYSTTPTAAATLASKPLTVAKKEEGPGFWSATGDFLRSEGFQNLLTSGLTTYQAVQAQRAADRSAELAAERARTEQMLAMESIKNSQQERELQQRLIDLQGQQAAAQRDLNAAVSSGSGMPGWVIPAALGGGALLLLLVVMSKKKPA